MQQKNKISQILFLSSFLYILSLFWFLAMIMISKGSYVYSIIVIIISLSIFIYYNLLLGRKIKRWEKLKGTYQKFTLEKIIYWDIRTSIGYRPYFSYSYTVNNNIYRNDRLSILKEDYLMWTEKGANKLIQKDTKERTLTVYYNPSKPEESLLIPRYSPVMLFKLYVFLFFAVTLSLRVIYEVWA